MNVLDAARERISTAFDIAERVCVSFSGGKDSTAMLHLVMDEAIRRDRRVGLLYIDLEAQYQHTVGHIAEMFDAYKDHVEPHWVSLPLHMRNAVSQFEHHWVCWDPSRRNDWVREPPGIAITDETFFPFFRRAMEFEDFVPEFSEWYAQGRETASFIGIRTDESLNRWRTITSQSKGRVDGHCWTTRKSPNVFNAYPLYDWRTRDVWIYQGKSGRPYNRLYDRMHQAGLSIHQMRICQPYGDDQRKGLWLWHIIEPDSWGRVVARVNGANQGALYAGESGNILGNIKVSLPDGHTWKSFSKMLLDTMPKQIAEHYERKILVFLHWYSERGYPNDIPDEGPITNAQGQPSWKRICKALLRNDYWCRGIGFSQHKTGAYENYKRIMARRKDEWGIEI
jgi:predicted phosphoadenosine phosphosulfate sulfurtransferase